jgi:hypothetical protein
MDSNDLTGAQHSACNERVSAKHLDTPGGQPGTVALQPGAPVPRRLTIFEPEGIMTLYPGQIIP